MKALVVDDSSVMRKIVVRALAVAGIENVDQASNGEEALEAISLNTYALVMMDWNMPTMTGIDAVRKIRGGGNDVPIIMVTTESDRSRILEAIKAGVSDYVMKPFSNAALAETVRNVLSQHGDTTSLGTANT
jgi:two-component system chemotaxis response regulator CheY